MSRWLIPVALACAPPAPVEPTDPVPTEPCLYASLSSLVFENRQVGISPPSETRVSVGNACSELIDVQAAIDHPAFNTDPTPFTLAAEQAEDLTVAFEPLEPGTPDATLVLSTATERVEVDLIGTGLAPLLESEVVPTNLPRTEVGCSTSARVRLANPGTVQLAVWYVRVPTDLDLRVVQPRTWPVLVEPQATEEVELIWSPTAAGTLEASVSVLSDDRTEPEAGLTIPLSGESFAAEELTETFPVPDPPGPDDPTSDGFALFLARAAVPGSIEVHIDGSPVPSTYLEADQAASISWSDRPPGARQATVRYVPQPDCD